MFNICVVSDRPIPGICLAPTMCRYWGYDTLIMTWRYLSRTLGSVEIHGMIISLWVSPEAEVKEVRQGGEGSQIKLATAVANQQFYWETTQSTA